MSNVSDYNTKTVAHVGPAMDEQFLLDEFFAAADELASELLDSAKYAAMVLAACEDDDRIVGGFAGHETVAERTANDLLAAIHEAFIDGTGKEPTALALVTPLADGPGPGGLFLGFLTPTDKREFAAFCSGDGRESFLLGPWFETTDLREFLCEDDCEADDE